MRHLVVLATCTVVVALPSVAYAEIVLAGGTVAGSRVTPLTGAQLGNNQLGATQAPTASPGGFQQFVIAPGPLVGGPGLPPGTVNSFPCGSNCGPQMMAGNGWSFGGVGTSVGTTVSAPFTSAVGWTTGGRVGIGFAPAQNNDLITLDSLSFQLYQITNPTGASPPVNAVGPTFVLGTSFSSSGQALVGPPITIGGPNNGGTLNGTASNPFLFRLNAPEADLYNSVLAADCNVVTPCRIALNATMTGGNGNADAFFAFQATNAVLPNGGGTVQETPPPGPPIPVIALPATLPLFASGLGVVGLLGWRRQRKSTTSVL